MMDKEVMDADWVSFHPMDNTMSTCINQKGIQKIRELAGRHEKGFEVIDFAHIPKTILAAEAKVQKTTGMKNRTRG